MEYAAPVWDPYYNVDIYKLEKVQRRATRWIQPDYSRTTSVTSQLSYIDISTLEQRRQSSRLVIEARDLDEFTYLLNVNY